MGAYNETNTSSSRTTQSTWRSDPSTLDSSVPQLLTTASSTFTAQQSDTEPALSGDKLAAVIVVCIAIPTLTIIGAFQYRRKQLAKRKAVPAAYLESTAARGHGPPQSPKSGPFETQPDRVRGDRRLNKGRTGPTPERQTDTDRGTRTLLLEEAATPQLPSGPPTDYSAPPPYSP